MTEITLPVLVKVSSPVMKHHDPRNMGLKGLISLYFHSTVHHQRKSGQKLKLGRNLETRADAEAVITNFLLCSASFLVECRTTSPRMAPPSLGWALPVNH